MDDGKGDQKKLAQVTSTSIKDIVKEQLDLGFHAVSDGEYPRHMFCAAGSYYIFVCQADEICRGYFLARA